MTTTDAAPAPTLRSLPGRLADAAMGRVLGLPSSAADYTVTRGLRAPMRDGVELLADHYAPLVPALGTLLLRGPYGRSGPMPLLLARVYAGRGYHVVLQSTRGTFGSGGEFRPMVHEVDDGADTVAWLREQPWFGGRFATIGLSYLGFTQWALLMDPPPELVTAVVMVGPHDFHRAVHGTGAFNLNDFLGWSEMVAHQEDGGQLRGLVRQATASRRLTPALNGTPLVEAGEGLLAGGAPWYRDWASRADRSDPFWQPMLLGEALDRVQVPVLLLSGWQDLFLDQTLDQYAHLRGRGVDVALTVGPWTHVEMLTKGAPETTREILDWLAEHLARTTTRRRPSPVRVHVTGAGEWRDLPDWPPATTAHVLYPLPGGGLGTEAPGPDAPAAAFTFDPADPTPTIGGRLLSPEGGYRDDTALAARDDVLTFTTPPLTAPLEVVGVPAVEVVHRSDNPHADLFVRVCEVDVHGRSRNVTEVFRRLEAATGEGPLRLDLDACAHRFPVGSRVRLLVAGGSHPHWARNLGTGEDPATGTAMKPSHRTIALAGGATRLVLPVTG